MTLEHDDRTQQLRAHCVPLPGSVPYDNRRRMSVAGRFDGARMDAFLAAMHPHIDLASWRARAQAGHLEVDGRVVSDLQHVLRAGCQIVHVIPGEVEPPVASDLSVLHEDDHMLVLDKPAPLPVHPCGRFNKNTVIGLLRHAFPELHPRPVHRLDADTTGVLVLAKTRAAARHLAAQFEARTVQKAYLARVHGRVAMPRFSCTLPLSARPEDAGKRIVQREGLAAHTDFERVAVDDATSLVVARPVSGRTNQIRVHLAALGFPIVGDEAYARADEAFTSGRSRLHLHAWTLCLRHPQGDHRMKFESRPSWA